MLIVAALACLHSGCRPDEQAATSDAAGRGTVEQPVQPSDKQPAWQVAPRQSELLVFPDTLRVDDTSVNAFVERAMMTCAGGDYDAFRMLWSAREDPLPRAEYDQAWHAVQKIRIRALQQIALAPQSSEGRPEHETVYVVLAAVSLDPNTPAGQREPDREAVLMLVREQDEWRLGNAPKAVRIWIKTYVAPADGNGAIPRTP